MADLLAGPERVVTHVKADLAVAVDPVVLWPETIYPARTVTYDIEPYYVVDGQAVKDDGLPVVVEVVIGLDGLDDVVGFPMPDEVDTGATVRWLATDISYADDGTWSPSRGDVSIPLVAPAAVPAFMTSAQYWRGDTFVTTGAVSLDSGEYLRLDAPGWSAYRLTVLMVAILRAPSGTWYSVLEAGDIDPDTEAATPTSVAAGMFDTPHLSVRYTGDGEVSLVSSTTLARTQVNAGLSRALQPVVIGFSADVQAGRATLLAADGRPHVVPVKIPVQPPLDAALWVGRTASVAGGLASMEIFEIDLWEGEADAATLIQRMAALDRAYGVSAR